MNFPIFTNDKLKTKKITEQLQQNAKNGDLIKFTWGYYYIREQIAIIEEVGEKYIKVREPHGLIQSYSYNRILTINYLRQPTDSESRYCTRK